MVTPRIFEDPRGHFFESYKFSEFAENGISAKFIQDNCSRSSKHVLRGLHYQKNPAAQGKLVRVLSGRIFDVAVDIRHGSPTYGRWFGIELSEENRKMLWMPPGCAHGFLALSDQAEVHYKVSNAEYSPEHDRGLMWNDPEIGISWPCMEPILSEKDTENPTLANADNNFVFEGT